MEKRKKAQEEEMKKSRFGINIMQSKGSIKSQT